MKTSITLAVIALTAVAGEQAHAQEKPWTAQHAAAPSQAFEIALSTGYTQPFGHLMGGVGMPSVASAGIGAELDLGYRASAQWGVSLGAQYQELTSERAQGSRGLSTSILVSYHVDPTRRVDPWIEVGTGYRFLWESNGAVGGPTVLTHGFELARLRLGLDFRGAEQAAIGPVVGADATVFTWQDAGTSSAISDPRLSTFIFAGIQGRLDAGGNKVGTTTTTAAPVSEGR